MSYARISRAQPLLGTLVGISLAGRGEDELHHAAAAAFAGIAHIHELMSVQSATSELSTLNDSPVGTAVRISPHTWRVLALAEEISRLSDGAFDVTVGAAMMARDGAAGMHREPSERLATYRDIELLDGSRVRFRRALAVDVGGIAKGYAVDHAVRILRRLGVPAGCVNAGGDLRAFGDDTVAVQVRDPDDPGTARAHVDLRNRALATSANYRRDNGFKAAGLVLDPRAGLCAVAQGRSASVRAKSCAVADALAKCVLLLGASSAAVLRHYHADGFLIEADTAFAIDTRLPVAGSHSAWRRNRSAVSGPATLAVPLRGRRNGGRQRAGSEQAGLDKTVFDKTGVAA
jgi:thiamine biosynthesis lipoprotein